MDRMACVNLPALPLQLLLHRRPDWREKAVGVVDRDRAHGRLLWVNDRARHREIYPGMRYAAALALDREFCADPVDEDEVQRHVRHIYQCLHHYSPGVESYAKEPGVFFLDARGMDWERASPQEWVESIRDGMFFAGYEAHVVLGFQRFAVWAEARLLPGARAFRAPDEEMKHIRLLPLDRLDLHPRLREALAKLAIHHLGAFLDLPVDSLARRLGKEALDLHQRARGRSSHIAPGLPPQSPLEERLDFEIGESDLQRLQVQLEPLLQRLLSQLGARQEALACLSLHFELEDHTAQQTHVSPALPSLDLKELMRLLRLRLEGVELSAGISSLRIRVRGGAVSAKQFELWLQRSKRNPADAARAFAELRAEFGNQVVQVAVLQDRHLPEAGVQWRPLQDLRSADPPLQAQARLIRQMYTKPVLLAPPFHVGTLPTGVLGPMRLSGGWWQNEQDRSYYYIPLSTGGWRWVYHDHKHDRWYEQGRV